MYGQFNTELTLIYPKALISGTWSASLRYDVAGNIALKAQLSRPQVANANYIADPNFTSSERVSVFSFGADFVF
jgi:hypothetical protein